jgi:hypothetical protein
MIIEKVHTFFEKFTDCSSVNKGISSTIWIDENNLKRGMGLDVKTSVYYR